MSEDELVGFIEHDRLRLLLMLMFWLDILSSRASDLQDLLATGKLSRLIHRNHHTATHPATRQESSGNASTSDECFVKCEESITWTSGDDAIEQPQWMDLCRVCVCF